jgi:hypothetical protein
MPKPVRRSDTFTSLDLDIRYDDEMNNETLP